MVVHFVYRFLGIKIDKSLESYWTERGKMSAKYDISPKPRGFLPDLEKGKRQRKGIEMRDLFYQIALITCTRTCTLQDSDKTELIAGESGLGCQIFAFRLQ